MDTLNAKNKERLQRAVEGNTSSQGYITGTKQEFAELEKAGLVMFNENIKDGNKFGLKATDAGIAAFNAASGGNTATSSPAGTVASKAAIQITKGITLPPIKRRGAVGDGGSQYPFDVMEIGDSFHVPKTEKMANPAKSLASSVTAANRKYSEKVDGQHKTPKGNMIDNYRYTREFTIRAVDKSDPGGEGARIWRTK